MNEYQKRLVNNPINQGKTGNYLFYGVPNDIEGKLFVKLLRRYINPKFKFYRQFRKSGSWSHSVNSTDGDSYVVYVDDKNKKQSEKEVSNLHKSNIGFAQSNLELLAKNSKLGDELKNKTKAFKQIKEIVNN